jgi:hypothetical protein
VSGRQDVGIFQEAECEGAGVCSVHTESTKNRNRHLNRHLVDARKAGGLENSGAGEGNRTLVISLGSWGLGASTTRTSLV